MDTSISDEEIDCIEEEDEGGVFEVPPGPIQQYRFEPDDTSDEEEEDEEEGEERRSGGEEEEENFRDGRISNFSSGFSDILHPYRTSDILQFSRRIHMIFFPMFKQN